MNVMKKMEIAATLRARLADWIIQHGRVLEQQVNSNEYTGVMWTQVAWRNCIYEILDVDGAVCRIDKVDADLTE